MPLYVMNYFKQSVQYHVNIIKLNISYMNIKIFLITVVYAHKHIQDTNIQLKSIVKLIKTNPDIFLY